MYAFASCTDQSTTAPAWPLVSLSPTTGCKRTDKQPLEVSQDAEEDKKQVATEKLTALGWICFSCHYTVFVKSSEEDFLNEVPVFFGLWPCLFHAWVLLLSLSDWIKNRSGKRWQKYFQDQEKGLNR